MYIYIEAGVICCSEMLYSERHVHVQNIVLGFPVTHSSHVAGIAMVVHYECYICLDERYGGKRASANQRA